jgi:RES domain-containing protein
VKHVRRGGVYYRVCGPDWFEPLDTAYARRAGGRWNPAGEFGALYLCATLEVAAANARTHFTGEIASLMDLQPALLPDLMEVNIKAHLFADAVSDDGLRAFGLTADYPLDAGWSKCQPIGLSIFRAGEAGIACRSAAEAQRAKWLGEELALFETHLTLAREGKRYHFDRWYGREHV